MKYFIFLFVICSMSLYGIETKPLKIWGDTNYSKQKEDSLTTRLNIEYKFILHEPSHKKWILYIKGILSPDYDHFGKEMKINNFTTLGIEF